MIAEMRTLTCQRTIQAPLDQVYRAFTNAQALREWFCDVATVVPRIGGRVYVAWHTGNALMGKYTALTPNATVELILRAMDDTDRSQVQVTMAAQGEAMHLTLVDSSDGASWHQLSGAIEQGWHEMLDNLQSVLESGIDLREVKRPMLGIYFGEQNPDERGARISGVIDGMDAQKAGLQKEDLVLTVGGQATPDWTSLTAALQPYRAGDQVAVTFDRAGRQTNATVTLSLRPITEIPQTPTALAATIEKAYAAINDELTQLLAEIDDTRATRAPAPHEWHIKQILAHLIAGERDAHSYLSTLIGSQERWQDDWEGNLPARLDAVIKVYPTAQQLLQAFIANEAETVAILAALPDAFVAHKRSYRRVAEWMLNWFVHTQEHVAQMRATLEQPA